MLSVSMDFDGGPTPHLNRKYADYWAIRRSNAEVHDRTSFVSLEDKGQYVNVSARKDDQTIRYRARCVIGADGPSSRVVRAVYPGYRKKIQWFMVGQKLHEIIECPLDEKFFHFWFHQNLGYYTWSHVRNGRQIVGVAFKKGDSFEKCHQRVLDYLEKRHGVKLGPSDHDEACLENFGLSLINRYVFGKGNVIITGQAAGFLNMMAEGMSCALHSGAIAGEATVDAFCRNRPVQHIYRKMIASEVQRCSDQWNPFKIAFSRPHEADFWGGLKRHRLTDRIKIVREICSFTRIFAPFRWGRQILWQAVCRKFRGVYVSSRWL